MQLPATRRQLESALFTALLTSTTALIGTVVSSPKASAATFVPISRIYAYGDSYSDNGASFDISTRAVNAGVPGSFVLPADPPSSLYDATGRWTNGPTAVEVLSNRLGVGLTDYAVGGAKSGSGNYYSWLNSFQDTGVFGQVDQFAASLSGRSADPSALHFIFASANDFFEYSDFGLPGSVEALAAQTVSNVSKSVTDLSALGVKQFIVVNSSDLDILPGVIEFGQAEDAAVYTDVVNNLLEDEIAAIAQQSDIEIALYDHVDISDKIRTNSQDYGLSNVIDPCQPVFPPESRCAAPDEYYFWDEYHPTEQAHRIIGEDMVEFIDSQTSSQASSQTVPEPLTTLGSLVIGSFLWGMAKYRNKSC